MKQPTKTLKLITDIGRRYGFEFAGYTGTNGARFRRPDGRVVFAHYSSPALKGAALDNIERTFRRVAQASPQVRADEQGDESGRKQRKQGGRGPERGRRGRRGRR